jgi:hypothetical protein
MSKYDKRDPDPQVIRLTRAGHFLWLRLKNRKSPLPLEWRGPFSLALETIWRLKREVKAELLAKRQAEWQGKKHIFERRAQ